MVFFPAPGFTYKSEGGTGVDKATKAAVCLFLFN